MMMMMMMGCVRPWLSGETGYVGCGEGAEQETAKGEGVTWGQESGKGGGSKREENIAEG